MEMYLAEAVAQRSRSEIGAVPRVREREREPGGGGWSKRERRVRFQVEDGGGKLEAGGWMVTPTSRSRTKDKWRFGQMGNSWESLY